MLGSRSKPARFFRTAIAAAFVAFIAFTFSAYIRLSEANLGCPDGPACTGQIVTPKEAQDVVRARNPNHRAWKDMVTRYIAGTLGFLLIRLAVLGWQLRRRPGQQVIIPVATLFLVFGLTAASLYTIDLQYKPLVMMVQFLGNVLVLTLLWWIALREQRLFRSVSSTPAIRALRRRAFVAFAFALLALTLGAWSAVNYAAPACPDFPTCQGEYWPSDDMADAVMRWSDEGLEYDRSELNLHAAAAVHFAHRLAALVAVLYLAWLSLHVIKIGLQESVLRYGVLLLVMLSFATALGVIEAIGGLHLSAAVAHSAAAVVLLLTLVTFYHVLRAPRAGR